MMAQAFIDIDIRMLGGPMMTVMLMLCS